MVQKAVYLINIKSYRLLCNCFSKIDKLHEIQGLLAIIFLNEVSVNLSCHYFAKTLIKKIPETGIRNTYAIKLLIADHINCTTQRAYLPLEKIAST